MKKKFMRLYLINPSNPLVSIVNVKESRWNRYRVWKPLSLMVLAGLTPSEWEISIVDENLGAPDYPAMPRPDLKGREFRVSVRRIQRHGILVAGSFIIGLDIDEPGIGKRIAEVASRYGVDNLNALFLTPLPGTRLWDQMKSEDRVTLDRFPAAWKYYTLTFPVAWYKHLSLEGIIGEMISCDGEFYSMPHILHRVWGSLWQGRKPLISLVGNFSYRNNLRLNRKAYANFKSYVGAVVSSNFHRKS